MTNNLNGYLKHLSKDNPSKWIDDLIVAGVEIVNLTEETTIKSVIVNNHFYHHDLVNMYNLWKVACIDFFRSNPERFGDEVDSFSEADSVRLLPHIPMKEYLDEPGWFKTIENIRRETKDKLATLRKSRQIIQTKLVRGRVKFSPKKSAIETQGREIPLPPYKNEYQLAQIMFKKHKLGEAVEWIELAQFMTGRDFDALDGKKDQRMVRDTAYALNDRTKATINTQDDLFAWKGGCVIRNF